MRRYTLAWALLSLIAGVVVVSSTIAVSPAFGQEFGVQALACGGPRGSGQTDRSGNLYVTCATDNGITRSNIQMYSSAGVRIGTIYLPTYATDVAPSPDGSSVYVFDSSGQVVRRWNRQLDGTWRQDPAWSLSSFQRWGGTWQPTGEFIATDDEGYIYVSTGTWTSAPNAIVKYAADGSFVTDVGDYRDGWELGDIFWMNSGIAVSPDGARVYLAEVGNNRIERFDRGVGGAYTPSVVPVGNSLADEDPRTGWCGSDVRAGRLAAPYDIGLDGSERLYVANTSCNEVKIFESDGSHVATISVTSPTGHIHGIAVDRSGRAIIAEANSSVIPAGISGFTAAAAPVSRWAVDSDKGWASVTPRSGAQSAAAWLWTSTGWRAATMAKGATIWIQPFASSWMWVWSGGSWYAMRTQDITVRR